MSSSATTSAPGGGAPASASTTFSPARTGFWTSIAMMVTQGTVHFVSKATSSGCEIGEPRPYMPELGFLEEGIRERVVSHLDCPWPDGDQSVVGYLRLLFADTDRAAITIGLTGVIGLLCAAKMLYNKLVKGESLELSKTGIAVVASVFIAAGVIVAGGSVRVLSLSIFTDWFRCLNLMGSIPTDCG